MCLMLDPYNPPVTKSKRKIVYKIYRLCTTHLESVFVPSSKGGIVTNHGQVVPNRRTQKLTKEELKVLGVGYGIHVYCNKRGAEADRIDIFGDTGDITAVVRVGVCPEDHIVTVRHGLLKQRERAVYKKITISKNAFQTAIKTARFLKILQN